jgi:hypothetical protein
MLKNDWNHDIEKVLGNIRINALYLSNEHKIRYFSLSNSIKWYRLPIIIFSGVNSIISVGLQQYVEQSILSLITSLISLLCSIIGSIELYLKKNSRMEADLISYTQFYLLSIEIYKTLTLDRANRPIPSREYLHKIFNEYTKLFESSNPLETTITDKLLSINLETRYNSLPITIDTSNNQLPNILDTSINQLPNLLHTSNNILALTHSAEVDRL